jgi:hypothetical protein
MIIAHYPGAGGHRYGLFLKNMPISTPDISMHQLEFTCFDYRYLTDTTLQTEIIDVKLTKHTHTLQDNMLEKFFPGHEIVKIKADFKQSLCREWRVVMKYYYDKHLIKDQVDQMFNMITWHHDYYTKYPPNWNTGVVVDVETDKTDFGKVMRAELIKTEPLFEFAWECFINYGSDAPIIDLYKEYEQSITKK